MIMGSKNTKTWDDIFSNPVKADISWQDVEALFKATGAEITEGNGSRVRVKLKGIRAVFHRPHPESVTDKGAVKSVRRFLQEAEVKRNDL